VVRAGASRYAHQSNDEFRIRSLVNGLYFDVREASKDNGAQLQTWQWLNGGNQRFRLQPTGAGVYSIISVNSGKVVDVDGDSRNDGAKVHQWENLNGGNQQFSIQFLNGYPTPIIAHHSKKALDVAGGGLTNGTPIQQWAFDANNLNQLFIVEKL